MSSRVLPRIHLRACQAVPYRHAWYEPGADESMQIISDLYPYPSRHVSLSHAYPYLSYTLLSLPVIRGSVRKYFGAKVDCSRPAASAQTPGLHSRNKPTLSTTLLFFPSSFSLTPTHSLTDIRDL